MQQFGFIKKKLNAPRPCCLKKIRASPSQGEIVVSHIIQRIGYQPGKTTVIYTVANAACGLLNREQKKKVFV